MRRRTRPGQTRCPRPKQKRCAPLPHERLRRPRTCSPGRKPSRNLRVFLREQGSQSAWLRAHDAELALTGGEANQTHSAGSHAAGRSHAAAVGCVYFAAAPNSAPPAPGPSAWSTWSAWHESRPRRSGLGPPSSAARSRNRCMSRRSGVERVERTGSLINAYGEA